jgi:hypothetical protein
MIRIVVICEGQTEETFVRDVIAPLLAPHQIFLTARLIPTSKNHYGGALSYERVRRFVLNTLKERQNLVVTTFFDLYALDNAFPGFSESQNQSDVYSKVSILEQAFKSDVANDNFSFSNRFLPYIQPYEFEGLLFSDIAKLTDIERNWSQATSSLQAVRDSTETPEHINDGYETKPSAQLEKHLRNPSFRKTLHGTLAIEAIGIDTLLAECQHFSGWYNQLTELKNN